MAEKVLLWGTGLCYKRRRHSIEDFIKQDLLEVIALISKDNVGETIDGHKVISKEEIANYTYDRIVITAEDSAYESIMKDISELDVAPKKVTGIASFIADHIEREGSPIYNRLLERQIKVIKQILAASDEEVGDYQWMYDRIAEFGVYPFDMDLIDEPNINWNERGVLQLIEEFTQYCNFISTLHIETAIELGVFRGRSSYLMCAILSRKNPALKYTLVDIWNALDSYDRFKEVLPALDKRIPATSEDFKGMKYDFAFIDADHSYDASMQDYLNVGQYANKITVFHDIYAHEYDAFNGGTVRMWKEVQEMNKDKECKTFSKYPGNWMGIGCVLHQ